MRQGVLLGGAGVGWLLAAAAAAQTASPAVGLQPAVDDTQVADIVVTAEKRSERSLDVPISITAVSGDQLAHRGITDVSQLEKIAPGFSFQESVFGTPTFSIRGVGFYDTSSGVSPTVSVYVDQVPLPYSAMARGTTLDLERVEVLKGPQGTLFGENSTGGAINYVAAKPTDALHAGVGLDIGNFDTVDGQAYVGGPLSDTLSARVAGRYEYRGDWQRGYAPNDTRLGLPAGRELGQRRFLNGRGLLDWHPSNSLKVELALSGWRDNSDTLASQFVFFTPLTPRNANNTATYNAFQVIAPLPDDNRLAGFDAGCCTRDDSFVQAALRAEWDLAPAVRLNTITAYSRYREDFTVDPDGTAFNNIRNHVVSDIESVYQELRLSGDAGRLRWMGGLNYSHDTVEQVFNEAIGTTNATIGRLRYSDEAVQGHQDVTTWAGFGSLDYALTDRLTLKGSVRYTTQRNDFVGCLRDSGDGQIAAAFAAAFHIAAVPGGCITQQSLGVLIPSAALSLDEHNVSFRNSLDLKLTPDTLLYASVAQGYKSGAFSLLPAVFASQFAPAKQEKVLAGEIGFKTAALDRRLQLTGAAFYYDYTDKQVPGRSVIPPFGPLPDIVNIPKSHVYGGELEATARPLTGLRLTAGISYVYSRVDANPKTPYDSYGNPANFIGESFPITPKWQLTSDIEYRHAVSASLDGFIGGGVTARTTSATILGNTTSAAHGLPVLQIPGYALLDLRAGVEAKDGRWRLQAWGRNVTDTFYLIQDARNADVVLRTVGLPATYGVSLGFDF